MSLCLYYGYPESYVYSIDIAFIFCSAADGSVHQIQVEVSLESHELKTQFSHTFECLHPSDSTPATALSLIQNKNHDVRYLQNIFGDMLTPFSRFLYILNLALSISKESLNICNWAGTAP